MTHQDGPWVVIMAGGAGKRFWPWSRRARPKQCLPVLGGASLLRRTLARSAAIAPAQRTVVVTARDNSEAVRAELTGREHVLVEPEGRNTAACVAWAAAYVTEQVLAGPNAAMVVLPADHFIGDDEAFVRDCEAAVTLAQEGWLVTLGIPPTRPETGYGWLQIGAGLPDPRTPAEPTGGGEAREAAWAGGRTWEVQEFKEKPSRAVAESWLAEGGRLWNSGIFVMRCDRFLREVQRWLPEHADLLWPGEGEPPGAGRATHLDAEGYAALPAISIDHGVMERAERVAVIAASFSWSDVGSWASLPGERAGPDAGRGGTMRGDVVEVDGGGNVLVGIGGLVATVGVQGLVVVHAGDSVLVCKVDEAQRVREVVDELERRGRDELL